RLPMRQPCRMALCPTVTSSPMTSANPCGLLSFACVTCSTEPSWILLRAPMRTALTSARITVSGHIEQSSAAMTSPITTALASIMARAPNCGVLSSKRRIELLCMTDSGGLIRMRNISKCGKAIMAASETAINPFLRDTELPDFPALRPGDVEPAFVELLAQNRRAIEALLDTVREPGWQTLIEPLEALDNRLEKAWAPVGHLNGVANTPEWRQAYEAVLPMLSAYGSWVGQNRRLYDAYLQLRASGEYERLDEARQKAIDNALRDFRLAGVALEGDARQRYGELRQQLADLSTRFSNNVLDATQGWFRHIVDGELLAGIPETALQMYRQAAQTRNLEGYVITLDAPSYLPVMQYAVDRELRRELYTAYGTRASDLGPQAGQWDNSALMEEILA